MIDNILLQGETTASLNTLQQETTPETTPETIPETIQDTIPETIPKIIPTTSQSVQDTSFQRFNVSCNNEKDLLTRNDISSQNLEEETHQSSSHDTSSQRCTVPCNNKYILSVGDDLENLSCLTEELTHQSSSHDTSSQRSTVPCNNKYSLCVGDDLDTLNRMEVTDQSSSAETIPYNVPCNNKNNLWCVRDDNLETLNNPEEELTQQTMSQSSSVKTIPFTIPCNNNNLCKRDDLNGSISLEKVSQSSSKELPWAWAWAFADYKPKVAAEKDCQLPSSFDNDIQHGIPYQPSMPSTVATTD